MGVSVDNEWMSSASTPAGRLLLPPPMATESPLAKHDALARASALATRARELRRAQSEVQDLTIREVQVLARTAASFFDTIPMAEFTSALLPQSARGLRRIRHRILHRTIQNTASGTLIRALLLGRDGSLRLFSARSADSRELLLILEPGRTLPVGVMRDVVEWTPMLRVPGFRPFEILDKLSHALDSVEEQITDAEARVQVQKAALTSGDLTALLTAPAGATAVIPTSVPPALPAAPVPQRMLSAPAPPVAAVASAPAREDPFDVFAMVEAVAAASVPRAEVAEARPIDPVDLEEPLEWDEPVEAPAARLAIPAMRSLFPVMPPPRS